MKQKVEIIKTEKITLGKDVMVSDPCYTVPTWCQIKVNNVLPGTYITNAVRTDAGDWGNRISYLAAVHEDYKRQDLNWIRHQGVVGVDSGQAGIFDMETYRNDSIVSSIGLGDGDISFFNQPPFDKMNPDEESGVVWYKSMCSRTLGEKQWGSYDHGVVSSSGIGDGSYNLYVARVKRKIVAFVIDFRIDERDLFPPNKKNYKLHPLLHGL